MAIYHSREHHYTGQFLIHGGYGSQVYGGAGTVYLNDSSVSNLSNISSLISPRTRLIVDNGGFSRSERIREMEKLSLYAPHSGSSTSYTAYHPFQFSVDRAISTSSYPLNRLTDGSPNTFFVVSAKESTLTVTVPDNSFLDHLKVFPFCDNYWSSR